MQAGRACTFDPERARPAHGRLPSRTTSIAGGRRGARTVPTRLDAGSGVSPGVVEWGLPEFAILRVLAVWTALHVQEHVQAEDAQFHTGVGGDVPGQHGRDHVWFRRYHGASVTRAGGGSPRSLLSGRRVGIRLFRCGIVMATAVDDSP